MKKQKALILAFILVCFSQSISAQTPEKIELKIKQISPTKTSYSIGDRINMQISAHQVGKECADGIHKIKIYCKGFEIVEQEKWVDSVGFWTKDVTLEVKGNKTKQLQVTAYRKTDKGIISEMMQFKQEK